MFAIQGPFLSCCCCGHTSQGQTSDLEAASRWGLRLQKFHFLLHSRVGPTVPGSPPAPSPSTNSSGPEEKQLKGSHSCIPAMVLDPAASTLTTAAKQKRPRGINPPPETRHSSSQRRQRMRLIVEMLGFRDMLHQTTVSCPRTNTC